MRALDTNVLVRLLVGDDQKQFKIAEEFVAKGAWVSHLVLAETMWVLGAIYDRTPMQIIALIDVLLAHEQLIIQDADTVTMALEDLRLRPALGFSDCLVVAIARKAGHTPISSFDKQLAKPKDTVRLPN